MATHKTVELSGQGSFLKGDMHVKIFMNLNHFDGVFAILVYPLKMVNALILKNATSA